MRCGVVLADQVIVNKGRLELLLLRGGSILRSYSIAIGRNPLGHKNEEGDSKTPEGGYVIDRRNPKSAYHLSLHV